MRFLFAILLAALAAKANAGGIEQLQRFWREVGALEGAFVQTTVAADGRKAKNARGRFWLSRPDRLRLEYEKPYRLQIVVVGQELWSWDADLAQESRSRLEERLGATPAALLTGDALEKQFTLTEAGGEDGLELVEARPKSVEAGFEWARVGLSGNLPRRLDVRDRLGQTTTLLFTELAVKPRLSAERFRFAPAGADR